MNLGDLKSGMKITTRNNGEYIVMLNPADKYVDLISLNDSGYLSLESYNDDLTDNKGKVQWDVVKVEKPHGLWRLFYDKDSIDWEIVWEHEDVKEYKTNEVKGKFGCTILSFTMKRGQINGQKNN